VVAADDDFLRMGKLAQPVYRGLDLAGATIVAQVAGVDKKVTIRDIRPFEGVGIGDANHSEGTGIWRRQSRRTAESQK
jgi:hypothetical protein